MASEFNSTTADSEFLDALSRHFIEGMASFRLVGEMTKFAHYMTDSLLCRFEELDISPGTFNYHNAGSLNIAITPAEAVTDSRPDRQIWRITTNRFESNLSVSGETTELTWIQDYFWQPNRLILAGKTGFVENPIYQATTNPPEIDVPPFIKPSADGTYKLRSSTKYIRPNLTPLPLLPHGRLRAIQDYNRSVGKILNSLSYVSSATAERAAPAQNDERD